MRAFLDSPENEEYILYPKRKEDYPDPASDPDKDWIIVFSSPMSLKSLQRFSACVIGADSNFKYTKYVLFM